MSDMKRREFITLLGGAAVVWPLAARAQQATKVPRIGTLSPGRSELPDPTLNMLNAFLQGLHELGYAEGQNVAIERQYAAGSSDRLRELAAELVRRKPDIIVVFSTTAARPAKQATDTIPIVAVGMADPVADELVASLARPGGRRGRARRQIRTEGTCVGWDGSLGYPQGCRAQASCRKRSCRGSARD